MLVIFMSLTGRERRTLAEIEDALVREDPAFAQRIAAINRIEAGDTPVRPASSAFWPRPWIERRVVLLLLAALGVITLLVIAVLLT
ncbi:DUF3040 domain-containing protein [Nonomuraea sp. 10N515B]|uniref:DUF3040 domain-containing protein n=1 Tax=Nonomuraea sp. 10N515B TaxID=3457422 RepID=UPI003FCDE7D0